jgi:hypothetical protein
MANPGPASTQTSNYLLNGSAADGVLSASLEVRLVFTARPLWFKPVLSPR